MKLPPGQREIDGFPRFGTHLGRPAPAVPADPTIEIGGAGVEPFAMPLARLATLPRRELTADFHCVAGWSATGLHWEGVAFQAFFREIIEPALHRDTAITHLTFGGLDGHRSVVAVEDALADDVLIAERLDGRPLDADHGAPARLVSPRQYGYISTKHLCRIELHSGEPTRDPRRASGQPGRPARAVHQGPPAGAGLGGGAARLHARPGCCDPCTGSPSRSGCRSRGGAAGLVLRGLPRLELAAVALGEVVEVAAEAGDVLAVDAQVAGGADRPRLFLARGLEADDLVAGLLELRSPRPRPRARSGRRG